MHGISLSTIPITFCVHLGYSIAMHSRLVWLQFCIRPQEATNVGGLATVGATQSTPLPNIHEAILVFLTPRLISRRDARLVCSIYRSNISSATLVSVKASSSDRQSHILSVTFELGRIVSVKSLQTIRNDDPLPTLFVSPSKIISC